MKKRIIPNGDKILVKPEKTEAVSKGGIIMAPTAQEEKSEGIVIEVGTGRLRDDGSRLPMRFQVGDRVLYGKYAGDEVDVEGEKYRIIRDIEVLAVIVEDK